MSSWRLYPYVYPIAAVKETKKPIAGWKWDETVWGNHNLDNQAAIIPSNWDPTTDGLLNTLFQSGIGSHRQLLVEKILDVPSSGLNDPGVYRLWSPEIRHGYYYDYNEQGYLYSDDSEVYYPEYDTVINTDCNVITLEDWPKVGIPVTAVRYAWNERIGKYETALSVRKKIYFTGTRDENGALRSTYDEETKTITWANVDQTLDEFIITDTENSFRAIFNKQYVEEIGADSLEEIGTSTGEAFQQFHSFYSPIDKTKGAILYSWIGTESPQEWTVVDYGTTLSDYEVWGDWDMGVFEFGDPDETKVPLAGYKIGIKYWTTVRLEFEPTGSNDTVLATEANINPLYRRSSRGFIYLSNQLEDPTSITLRAVLPEIQKNIFGPLLIGNTFAPIVATVKDSKGQLLEGQMVNFFMTSSPPTGSFGASVGVTEITSPTDEYGESRIFYSPPRAIGDISDYVNANNWEVIDDPDLNGYPEFAGLNQITKLTTTTIPISGEFGDMFLYEVHIDDPLLGYADVDEAIGPTSPSGPHLDSYYLDFFQNEDIWGPTGLKDENTLSQYAREWENAVRTVWNTSKPLIFSSSKRHGRKVLVSKIDPTMLDPYTFDAGAVGPVQPIAVYHKDGTKYDVIFDTTTHLIPKPTASDTSPTGTHYAYMIVAPTIVKLQASVYNRRLNRLILSNEITIKLNIPPYMSGLWIINAINSSHIGEISEKLATMIASGQRVPLGWRLRSTRITLAAALDGVTFLNVNPKYNFDPYDPDAKISLVHQVKVIKP